MLEKRKAAFLSSLSDLYSNALAVFSKETEETDGEGAISMVDSNKLSLKSKKLFFRYLARYDHPVHRYLPVQHPHAPVHHRNGHHALRPEHPHPRPYRCRLLRRRGVLRLSDDRR